MFVDIKKPMSSYRYATGQKPYITYDIDTSYLDAVVVNTNIDKIDSKKGDKYLQNNKISSEAAALPLLIAPYNFAEG